MILLRMFENIIMDKKRLMYLTRQVPMEYQARGKDKATCERMKQYKLTDFEMNKATKSEDIYVYSLVSKRAITANSLPCDYFKNMNCPLRNDIG